MHQQEVNEFMELARRNMELDKQEKLQEKTKKQEINQQLYSENQKASKFKAEQKQLRE